MEQIGVCCTQRWESCTFALSFQHLFGEEKKKKRKPNTTTPKNWKKCCMFQKLKPTEECSTSWKQRQTSQFPELSLQQQVLLPTGNLLGWCICTIFPGKLQWRQTMKLSGQVSSTIIAMWSIMQNSGCYNITCKVIVILLFSVMAISM